MFLMLITYIEEVFMKILVLKYITIDIDDDEYFVIIILFYFILLETN
jgi:hypothetical protein